MLILEVLEGLFTPLKFNLETLKIYCGLLEPILQAIHILLIIEFIVIRLLKHAILRLFQLIDLLFILI